VTARYYGWTVCWAACGILAVAFGVWYSFAAFVDPIAGDQHWSRADVLVTFSMTGLVYGLSGPLVGRMIERWGIRRTYWAGTSLLVAGLASSAGGTGRLTLYLTRGLVVGLGISCLGGLVAASLLAQWFRARRGTANGLAIAGNGVGILVLLPVARWMIESWGWRAANLGLAALSLVCLAPLVSLVREQPTALDREIGEGGHGHHDAPVGPLIEAGPGTDHRSHLRSARGTSSFWAVCATVALASAASQSVLSQQVSVMEAAGFSGAAAATAAGVVGLLSSLAKPAWGWLSDRVGRELTFTAGSCLFIGGMAAGGAMGGAHRVALVGFVVLVGVGYAVAGPLFPAIAGDLFPGVGFASVYGAISVAIGVGVATGPIVGGLLFTEDDFGSVLVFASLCAAASILTTWWAAPRNAMHLEGLS
jgi:MFS family permease